MKEFLFASGTVRLEETKLTYSNKIKYQVKFIGHGLFGWGISKIISRSEFNSFNVKQAEIFAEKASKMLSV